MPTGEIVYFADEYENVTRVSEAGRLFYSESYSRIKNHSPINVTAASGGTTFETVAVGQVQLYSESGNSPMYWGGVSGDSPYSGHGMPIFGGETVTIPVTSFDAVRVCATVSGQIIYAMGFLNGTDVILTNENPESPPTPPVSGDTTAPYITLTYPTSGYSGLAVGSQVYATFNEDISADNVLSGSFTISPSHNITIYRDFLNNKKLTMSPNVNFSGATTYYVGVTSLITDVAGNPVSGAPVIWPFTTVSGGGASDTTPPQVSGTNPAHTATAVSANMNVSVTFSEAMDPSTITATNIYLSYTSGVLPSAAGSISGTVTFEADNITATINPTDSLSDESVVHINLLSGITDVAGNICSGTNDFSRYFTTADITPPTVASTYPVSGASSVALNTTVIVTFSEQVLSGTITTSNLYLSKISGAIAASGITATVDLSGNNLAAYIDPSSNLTSGTNYYINVLSGVTDLVGNPMTAHDRERTFTTAGDFTPPTVTSTYPASGDTGVTSGVTVIVTFSEPVLSGTITTSNLYLSKLSGAIAASGITATVDLSGNNLSAQIDPSSNLDASGKYWINVLSGVTDLPGNPMAAHDRKRVFWVLGPEAYTQVYNVTNTAQTWALSLGSLQQVKAGLEMDGTACNLLNAVPTRVTMRLSKELNPTGTAYLRIEDGSENVLTTFGSIDVSTLTGTAAEYTITNDSNTTALQTGYRFLLEYSGGDASNYVKLHYSDTNAYTGTVFEYYYGITGYYYDDSSYDPAWTIYKAG